MPSTFPQDGWVEQDAEEIWQSVLSSASDALANTEACPIAIGIGNQRETTIIWDSDTGLPLTPAIVWQCRRTTDRCRSLIEAGHAEFVRSRTGLIIDPYFSGTKIGWLLDSDPDLRAAAESGRARFGTVDSWLLWKLTGGKEHVIDATNASRTMLADLKGPVWDDDLLDILNVPLAMLPQIVPSSGHFGLTAGTGSIPAAIPISGIAGDQQSALFGQACFDTGLVKSTYGTGCFLLANTGATIVSEPSLLTTVAWQIGSKTTYALEGSIFMGGSIVQWLCDGLGLIETADESEYVAASVPDTAGVMLVPAFVGLGAPYWDPDARGLIIGLTQKAGRAHLVRAGLEAIAHQVTDISEIMNSSGVEISTMHVDGGATQNNLLMQIQADLANCEVVRPLNIETTAMGAAMLAGLEVGYWQDFHELRLICKPDRTFFPNLQPTVTERRKLWRQAVSRSRNWLTTQS